MPAYEVLTPFAVDDGPTVLVDRGYVNRLPRPRGAAVRGRPHRHGDRHRRGCVTPRPLPSARSRSAATAFNRCIRSTPAQVSAVTGIAAGGFVPAAGGRTARWSRRDRHSASGRRAVPVLRHPVDRIRHPRPDRCWATSCTPRSDSAAGKGLNRAPRQRSGPRPAGRTTDYRGQARRPLRPAALRPTARAAASACTRRDIRTARRRSAAVGIGRRPASGRISQPWGTAWDRPSRTPSAPANDASTTPAFGLGGCGIRRQARHAAERSADRQANAPPAPPTRAATKLAASSNRAAAQPNRS